MKNHVDNINTFDKIIFCRAYFKFGKFSTAKKSGQPQVAGVCFSKLTD